MSMVHSLPMLIAIGATLSISYVFILQLIGYNLKHKNKKDKEDEENTDISDDDNVCVVYKNGEFSAFA